MWHGRWLLLRVPSPCSLLRPLLAQWSALRVALLPPLCVAPHMERRIA